MASLMENLISVLQEECTSYEELLELSMKKTQIIVQADLEGLQKITDEEQEIVGKINRQDALRQEVTKDIANVLNRDVTTLKLADIVDMLAARPEEQNRLAGLHDRLKDVTGRMVTINEHNKELIRHSLEMVEFDLTLIHSMKSAPQTANYNREACSRGSIIGRGNGSFDAKQ